MLVQKGWKEAAHVTLAGKQTHARRGKEYEVCFSKFVSIDPTEPVAGTGQPGEWETSSLAVSSSSRRTTGTGGADAHADADADAMQE